VNEILKHLVDYWSFLWSDGRYRITDSEVTTHFGGDSLVVISSDQMRLRFVRDRGQLFLDFQPPWAGPKSDWYSVDLVRRLLDGQRQESAESKDHVEFVREHFAEIESLFSDRAAFAVTGPQLDELKKLRSKERFG
jgi:hypothetical protein